MVGCWRVQKGRGRRVGHAIISAPQLSTSTRFRNQKWRFVNFTSRDILPANALVEMLEFVSKYATLRGRQRQEHGIARCEDSAPETPYVLGREGPLVFCAENNMEEERGGRSAEGGDIEDCFQLRQTPPTTHAR